MLNIAHRGASRFWPENTIEAFKAAFETFGAEMIEFDVHLSKDGVPVVIHDARLERTTNGRGYVSHFLFEELSKLDAAWGFAPGQNGIFPMRGTGISIPSLESIFQNFPNRKLAIEIKERSSDLTHKVMALVEKYGAGENCVVGSKYHAVSGTLQKSYPTVRRFYSQVEIVTQFFAASSPARHRSGPDPCAVSSMPLERCGLPFASRDFIDHLHAKGVTVFFWTVNDPAQMEMLIARGADGIITDDPGLLNSLNRRRRGTDPTNV